MAVDDVASATGVTTAGPIEQRRVRRRRWAFRVVALLGSLGLAIILVEAALWTVAPVPFHEWMIYDADGHIRFRPTPGQRIRTASGHEVRINRFGFRGPDYEFEKTPGTLRIEVFGGSAGFCYHAAGREKSWPGALERKLAERLHMPVEVINLSVPGFNIGTSLRNYLGFGRALSPDAIVVYHTWNDLKSFRRLAHTPYVPGSWFPHHRPLWQRIARATQIGRRVRMFTWRLLGIRMEETMREQEGSGVGPDVPVSPKALAWERRNFASIASLARQDAVLPVLVSQAGLPAEEVIDDPELRTMIAANAANMTLPRLVEAWQRVTELIREVAAEQGAIFVDGYNAVPHDAEHLRDHVHLRDAGSEKLAEQIARVLLADERFVVLVESVKQTRPIPPSAVP